MLAFKCLLSSSEKKFKIRKEWGRKKVSIRVFDEIADSLLRILKYNKEFKVVYFFVENYVLVGWFYLTNV